MSDYLIGIDLGTTNSTLSFTSLKEIESNPHIPPSIQQFQISQQLAAGTIEAKPSLPSFIYFPLSEEGSTPIIGEFAKKRGEEVAERVVSSAKSWLCHPGVDRRAPILPWQSTQEEKISPLKATSAYLEHLKTCWNEAYSESPLENQKILITVPASFDPSSRQLVQEAADLAGFPEGVLLEEPQAAFYAWLHRHAENWREKLTVGDLVLVVDIGGGTTDFSLISVEEGDGDLGLERIAVGEHLLLGGDNMDLALAHFAKNKLESDGHAIDDWQLAQLIHQCRRAKEELLGDGGETVDVTLQGRGRSLIGGAITTTLTKEEVASLIVEGFSPLIPFDDPERALTSGIGDLGLPYAKDPRMTGQLLKFLRQAGGDLPTKVLFNGGTMKAKKLEERIVAQLNQWADEVGSSQIEPLQEGDCDFAVSRGAAYYGVTRERGGVRVKGGLSRAFFIGIEEAGLAIPGIPPKVRAVCLTPFGLEEGEGAQLESQEFSLLLGESVQFRFFSYAGYKLPDGTLLEVGSSVGLKELEELPPIETMLDTVEQHRVIRVCLEAKVTELGVLELWCAALDGSDKKWKLEFNARTPQAV